MSDTDYVARNRAYWAEGNREYTDAVAERAWNAVDVTWGIFGNRESELRILGEVNGLDIVELGCGTAYFSAWLSKRGARPVGVDVTPAQLETARRLQRETGTHFPLLEANAEDVPLPDGSFDLALSEYGASIWCDPARWLPEAHRLLRPGGRLVFLRGTTLLNLCALEDENATSTTLQRPQRGMYRMDWPDGGTEFHPGTGEMFAAVRTAGFGVERFIELFAPDGARAHEHYSYVTAEWARKWPAEEIWVVRKGG